MKYNDIKKNTKRKITQTIVTLMIVLSISFTGMDQGQTVMAKMTDKVNVETVSKMTAETTIGTTAEKHLKIASETTAEITLETAVEPSGEEKFVDDAGKEWAKQAVIFATLRSAEAEKLTATGTQLTVFFQKADGNRENRGKMQVSFSQDGKIAVGTMAVTENGQYIVEAVMEKGQKNEAIQTVDCIDRTPPKVSQMVLEPFIWIEDSVKIVVTAKDAVALAEKPYSWDGGASWSDKNYIWAEKEGVYNVLIKDALGNISEAAMEAKKWQGGTTAVEGESLSKVEETDQNEQGEKEQQKKESSKGSSKQSTYQIKVKSSKEKTSIPSGGQTETGNSNTTDNQDSNTNQSGQKIQIEADKNSANQNGTKASARLKIVAAEATIAMGETDKGLAKNEVPGNRHAEDGLNSNEKTDNLEDTKKEKTKEKGSDEALENSKEKSGQQKKEKKNVLERVKEVGAVLAKGTLTTIVAAGILFGVYLVKKKDMVMLYCFEYDKVHKKLGEVKLSKKEDVYVLEIAPQLLLKEKGSHYILRFSMWFVNKHKDEQIYISYLQQSFQAEIQREITFSV